jgi:hypothetical protein
MPAPSQCARHPLACYDQAATSTEDSESDRPAGPARAPGSDARSRRSARRRICRWSARVDRNCEFHATGRFAAKY